jgi:hypothetical protein
MNSGRGALKGCIHSGEELKECVLGGEGDEG